MNRVAQRVIFPRSGEKETIEIKVIRGYRNVRNVSTRTQHCSILRLGRNSMFTYTRLVIILKRNLLSFIIMNGGSPFVKCKLYCNYL